MRAALPLLVASLLAGCLAGAGAGVEAVPYAEPLNAEPGGFAEVAFALRAERAVDLDVSVIAAPPGWTVELETTRASVPPEGTTVLASIAPHADARYGFDYVAFKLGPREVWIPVEVEDAGDEPLRPGLGALVRTVGFWDNGTVFYTNMKEVHDNPNLRAWSLGEGEPSEADFEPLKVYVGGTRGTPPPEPYNASGYRPVIGGFDAELRGMRAGEWRTVRIAPEDAYTRPGNEEHPLYGDALNFMIEVVRVDDLGPAPGCGLPVCPPVGRDGAATSAPPLLDPAPLAERKG